MIGTQFKGQKTAEPIFHTDHLTLRELEILSYLAERLTNQEIANRLTLTLSTVKWYIRQILRKLGADNRRQAVQLAQELGILREDTLLRTLKHNLPNSLTPIIGREVELEAVAQLLHDPQCRLLTLTGPAGIGKTRLAIQVGLEMVKQKPACFSDGVYFVPLAPLTESASIAETIAKCLNFSLHDHSAESRTQLFNYLRRKKMLLILDNYEHLTDEHGAMLPVDLLATAPQVKILVTSRKPLNVLDDQLLSLEGLHFPESISGVSEHEIAGITEEYGSVRLFQLCAKRVQPGFKLDDHNIQPVMHICQLAGGMPLAIELAASLISVLEPGEIAAEIVGNSDILDGSSYDIPQRQRSMHSIFDTSWELLAPEEKIAVQSLSVYREGFTRDSAEVAMDVPLKTLLSCVQNGWIQPQENSRFKFHELLKQYARENLKRDLTRWREIHNRHSAYYCRYLGEREADWHNSRQLEALIEIQVDYQNILLAWEWSVEQANIDHLIQAAESLFQYFKWTGRYRQGRALFETALDRLKVLTGSEKTGHTRMQILRVMLLARLASLTEEYEPTNQLYQQALDICCQLERSGMDTRFEKARILLGIGMDQIFTDPQQAGENLQQALDLFENRGDLVGMSNTLLYIGAACWIKNEFAPALNFNRQGLVIAGRIGNRKDTADALDLQAKILRSTGNFIESEVNGRESVALAEELGLHRAAAVYRANLAHTLIWAGRFSEAQNYAEASQEDFDKLHGQNTYAMVLLARALLHQRHCTLARYYANLALDLDKGTNDALVAHQALWILADCALLESDFQEARERLSECASICSVNRQDLGYRLALADLSICATLSGRTSEACKLLCKCLENTTRLHMFLPAIQALPALTLLSQAQGDSDVVIETLELANRYSYLANSLWFQQVVGDKCGPVFASGPAVNAPSALARASATELWDFIDKWMSARAS